MNAILVLFGGRLAGEAFEPVVDGKNSLALTLEQAKKFPGVKKIILLAACEAICPASCGEDSNCFSGIQIEQRDAAASVPWTKRSLLEKIAELSAGYDLTYFAFADSPFLDPALAADLAERHLKYRAEYSYSDGWPQGLAPELLSPGTAGILSKILGDDDGPVERDILFSVIQKDINAFDIETEISTVDLRCHRINFYADSKRNLLLLKNFISAAGGKIPGTQDVERIILEQPEALRTLPAFFPVQVYGGCPQSCALCPYPSVSNTARTDYMDIEHFESLLDKITAFSGDAVIALSLWGELSLHPEKIKLIEAVVSRNELALVIETSGIGWKSSDLEKCAELCAANSAAAGSASGENLRCGANGQRKQILPPLSWIVSLDTADSKRYSEIHGNGFSEASDCVKKLFSLFPKDCYVQAVRTAGAEDDIEKFYRYWKENSPCGEKNIIIQKYDDFCGFMEKKQASDISPVIRQSCWHIMRDMPVLIDGTVPLCREELNLLKGSHNEESRYLGNVFTDSLDSIWKNGTEHYNEHCKKNYKGQCKSCDEYYTYNF